MELLPREHLIINSINSRQGMSKASGVCCCTEFSRQLSLGADSELHPGWKHICDQSHSCRSLSWDSMVLQESWIMLCVGHSSGADEKGRVSCEIFHRGASFRRNWSVIRAQQAPLRHIFWEVCEWPQCTPGAVSRSLCGAIRISVRSSEDLSSGTCSWLIAAERCQHSHWLKCKSWRGCENTFWGVDRRITEIQMAYREQSCVWVLS